MNDPILETAQDLARARHAVALTGSGISVESGIPPFRGKGGIWERIDPMEFAHIEAFLRNPAKVWQVLISEMKGIMDVAQPNDGHRGLARLEAMGILKTVITQNVDSLHQRAGNTDVIEFHGTFARQRCQDCGGRIDTRRIDLSRLPPLCACGGIYRPDCVFFGEMIPPDDLERSRKAAMTCDLMLVVGTSAVVQPAAFMPLIARDAGAKVIEINPEPTPLTGTTSHRLIKGTAGEVMRRLVAEVERLTESSTT